MTEVNVTALQETAQQETSKELLNVGATRESLAANVETTRKAYKDATSELRSFEEAHRTSRGVGEKRPRRRQSGIPPIMQALVIVFRENNNRPMQANEVYEALVCHTEWTYESRDLREYVKFTLSKHGTIFARPHVNVGTKVQKRGWYALRETSLDSTVVPAKVIPTVVSTSAEAILNTEITLGANQNPFTSEVSREIGVSISNGVQSDNLQ